MAVGPSVGPSEGLFGVKGTRLGSDSGSNTPELGRPRHNSGYNRQDNLFRKVPHPDHGTTGAHGLTLSTWIPSKERRYGDVEGRRRSEKNL